MIATTISSSTSEKPRTFIGREKCISIVRTHDEFSAWRRFFDKQVQKTAAVDLNPP